MGLYYLAKLLINRDAGIVAMLFYILSPFNLFFDRLALLDSPINTIAIFSLLFSCQLFKTGQIRYGVILGFLIGIGLWIKSTGQFYFFLPIISLLWYLFKEKSTRIKNMQIVKAIALSVSICLAIFIPLYIHPFYKELLTQMKQFTNPPEFILNFPAEIWTLNVIKSLSWLVSYLTLPIFFLFLIGVKYFWNLLLRQLVLLWFLAPFLYIILYAGNFTSRHILILSAPVIIIAATTLIRMYRSQKLMSYLVLGIVILVCMIFDFVILFNPVKTVSMHYGQAQEDMKQYFYGIQSGYGVGEAIAMDESLSKKTN